MKKLIVILLIAFPLAMTAQMTYVPDNNFEQALINLGYDSSPLNDSVPTKNIDTVTYLNIESKNISDLTGIEDFIAILTLNCNYNQLKSLDLSKNIALVKLYCVRNGLTSLDFSKNSALEELFCFGNVLSSLDFSKNPSLYSLNCHNNKLTSMDLSRNTLLNWIYSTSNQLTSLDLSNIIALKDLDTRNNPNLYCIRVEDSSLAANNTWWYKDDWAIYSEDCGNPGLINNTYIPDDKFEKALIDLGYDKGSLNDSVPTKKINKISYLNIGGKSIIDLTGIEDFISLDTLMCAGNDIAKLDLSKNTDLDFLYCYSNWLKSLDLSNNTALKELHCWSNYLMSLDLSKNHELEILNCTDNDLTSLNLNYNTNLKFLVCSENKLTNIDISENFDLIYLDLRSNQLTSLDVSNNTSLLSMACSLNQLNSLDLSNNSRLDGLYLYQNQLTSLDLSKNMVLKSLDCSYNHLTSLDLSKNLDLIKLVAMGNKNLYCIQVKDSSFAANKPDWDKDKWAVYSEDCSSVGVDEGIDVSYDISISPNPASDYIEITNLGEHTGSPLRDINIYNSLGECVITPLAFGEGTGVRLDISPLPPGLYFLSMKNGNEMQTSSFVVLK